MRSLTSALKTGGEVGEPLPPVFQGWVEKGADIRRGQLTMLASGPGGGKSALALTLAYRARVPTLYIAPDSDAYTSFTRLAAMMSGDTTADVENAVRTGTNLAHYESLVGETNEYIRWDFRENPHVDDIVESVESFAHLFGQYPSLVVFDNLGDVYSDDENESQGLKKNLHTLKMLAGESNAAVLVLHHLTGEYESGDVPPPLSALAGKVSKPQSLVITLFRARYGDVGTCIVKNRFGEADPRGNARVYLEADLARMRIT